MRDIAFWLSLALVFTIPWENVIFLESLGTVSRAVGLIVAAFWVATVVVTGKVRKPRPFHIAIYLFVLWNIISVFWSLDIEQTMYRVRTYAQLVGLILIIWDLYATPKALQSALQAYVLGAYVAVGSTVFNYVTAPEATSIRFAATGFNPNDLGLILALGMPAAWHLATGSDLNSIGRVLRPVNFAYIPAALLAILLTASRGSLLATVPALVFIGGSLPRLSLPVRSLAIVALTAALFAVQPLVPQASIQRLMSTSASISQGGLGGRMDIWRQGLAISTEHPLLGVGGGAFREAMDRYPQGTVAHNVFLSVFVELGIVGLGLFAVVLVLVVAEAMQQPRQQAWLWLATLMVWTIGAFVHTWEHKKPTWLFLDLVVVGAGLVSRDDESWVRLGSWAGSTSSTHRGEGDRDYGSFAKRGSARTSRTGQPSLSPTTTKSDRGDLAITASRDEPEYSQDPKTDDGSRGPRKGGSQPA
jgi:O-antigen ligase